MSSSTLLCRALEHQEAVLLVGETGVGKTTLCQTLAFVRGQRLRIINCNLHTEAADMLGGYRPARNRTRAFAAFLEAYSKLEQCAAPCLGCLNACINPPCIGSEPGFFSVSTRSAWQLLVFSGAHVRMLFAVHLGAA